ncbi:MAG: extracellular solute-binding protein [Oscillospiraceae bacterium]|jgi:multiple sugar transport system substrate-binding protein/raffinose/stachyose/melibiose transport system substrate-binding protein|nr:extracellular solute-binding protein [Oscillospiraceae bacterium]
MKKIISAILMLTLLLSACVGLAEGSTGSAPVEKDRLALLTEAASAETLAYKGGLEIMHFSTSEEAAGNGASVAFRTINTAWAAAHPDVTLSQNILANDEYKTQIAVLAGADDLPDVFLLQGMNTAQWAAQGLIYDLTETITNSPDVDSYDLSKLYAFTSNDKYYGYPVLTEGSCVVLLYDKQMWKDAGYDSFPETWDEVLAAKEYFDAQGINVMAFGNGGKWQVNSTFLTTVGDRFTGHEWFYSLIEKGGAKFTDPEFVSALKFTQDIFASGIFNPDFNVVTNEDAREYYISGDAASYIGGNWDVMYMGATLKEIDPEKYANIGFAVLPQPAGATATYKTHATGQGYAVAINAKLTGDKLEAAKSLAAFITGPEYGKYVGEDFALSSFAAPESVDLSAFDQFTQDFYNYYDNEGSEIYDSYLTGEVWDVLNTDLQNLLNGTITPEEVAEKTEAAYESSYLN